MISKTRWMAVLGGFLLAWAVLALLALAGVGSQRPPAGEPARPAAGPLPAPEGDPLTATQPELRQALLNSGDLPPGYAPSATPGVTAPSRRNPLSECQALFEGLGPVTGVHTAQSRSDDPTGTLRQAVSVFPPGPADGADEAYASLRRTTARCPRFTAALDDGRTVVVELAEVRPARLVERGREGFTVRLVVTGARDDRMTGYLAIGRAGQVLSVLRRLGTAEVAPDEEASLLRRALAKLTPLLR